MYSRSRFDICVSSRLSNSPPESTLRSRELVATYPPLQWRRQYFFLGDYFRTGGGVGVGLTKFEGFSLNFFGKIS